jgi:hypothetical protein
MSNFTSFYTNIPPMLTIRDMTNPKHYHDVPETWFIAMTDVRGATAAIEAGKYKEVSAVAAASIAAQINIMKEKDAPFVFGGDGASVLMPPEAVDASRKALAGTRKMAREQFGLDLRAALMPVKDVLKAGHHIRIARLEMSPNFQQAIFNGGGMRYAETIMKDPILGQPYHVPEEVDPIADFYGIHCRWNQIPSAREENVTLLVRATGATSEDDNAIYQQIFAKIESLYGDFASRHPIALSNMTLSFAPKNLNIEGKILYGNRFNVKALFQILWENLQGKIAMAFKIGKWGTHKQIFYEATDHEKFDDTLRMIFSGTAANRATLTAYLDEQYQQGRLVYGLHHSSAALVTCIVYDYFGHQMHLMDGSSGGYTLAAKAMKAQLQTP